MAGGFLAAYLHALAHIKNLLFMYELSCVPPYCVSSYIYKSFWIWLKIKMMLLIFFFGINQHRQFIRLSNL